MRTGDHCLRRLGRRARGFFLARDCLLCGEAAADAALCEACHAALPRLPAARCPQCALPALGGLCGQCQRQPPPYAATVVAFRYAFPLDVLIHGLKYRRQLSAVSTLAEALATAGAELVAAADLVLPMPVHVQRLRERGYNQAVELARPLCAALAAPLALDVVRKLRNTPAQAGLARAARLRNPQGAFHCRQTLAGAHVVVIDDVMTTGATLAALAQCLRAAGAARVSNLVLARAVGRAGYTRAAQHGRLELQ